MIIGIDGNEANVKQRVGVSWYVFHVLKQLREMACEKNIIRVFLRDKPQSDMPKQTRYFSYIHIPGKSLWSQIYLPFVLWTRNQDLSIFISPAHYAPRSAPCPVIVVLHDLSYLYYPNDFKKRDLYKLINWTRYSVQKAQHIVAVSRTTAEDAFMWYKIKNSRISVVYNGFSKPSRILTNGPYKKKKQCLYIGTLQPRKNIETLMYAWSLFIQNNPDYSLHIIGKKGWMYNKIFKTVKHLNILGSVVFHDYVSEKEKYILLKQSFCIVLPGYYEGFGLPMLEAFWARTPVIASSTGSLPEIGRSACAYFYPFDEHELANILNKISKDKKYADELVCKGIKRLKAFNWKTSAMSLLSLCKSICSNRN